jgi:hypothetical protein
LSASISCVRVRIASLIRQTLVQALEIALACTAAGHFLLETKRRAYAGPQLDFSQRLGDVVSRPSGERQRQVILVVAAGHHDDGHVVPSRKLLDVGTRVDACVVRQVEIHHDEVEEL